MINSLHKEGKLECIICSLEKRPPNETKELSNANLWNHVNIIISTWPQMCWRFVISPKPFPKLHKRRNHESEEKGKDSHARTHWLINQSRVHCIKSKKFKNIGTFQFSVFSMTVTNSHL